MNFKQKYRSKWRLLDSFGGTYRNDKSAPVLLGVKKRPDEDNLNAPTVIQSNLQSPAKGIRRQKSTSTLLDKITSEYRKLPTRSVSICYNPANKTLSSKLKLPRLSLASDLTRDNRKNKNKANISEEIELFEKKFVEPLSTKVRDHSYNDKLNDETQFHSALPLNILQIPVSSSPAASITSDSNYDSGAFSRNSTPEPASLRSLEEVEPLTSPPLVLLSANKNHHNNNNEDFESIVDALDGSCNFSEDGKKNIAHIESAKDIVSHTIDGYEIADDGPVRGIKSQMPEHLQTEVTITIGSLSKLYVNETQKDTPQPNNLQPNSPQPHNLQPNSLMKCNLEPNGKKSQYQNPNSSQHNPQPSFLVQYNLQPNSPQQHSLPLNSLQPNSPNLNLSRAKMPHMGMSRLTTPPKPPRLKTPARSMERSKISTVILNSSTAPSSPVLRLTPMHQSSMNDSVSSSQFESSFTAVSGNGESFYVKASNPFRDDILKLNPLTKDQLRNGRGGSCSSDASSGVFCGSGDFQVTVNGSHHCNPSSDHCDDTLSTCEECGNIPGILQDKS